MDSVVGDDLTLPVDINGSCRLPDSMNAGDFSTDSMTAPSFPEKMSPIKALTMKDYENQITALKKENFNLKLRIYFMEERMQQKCDDSTEDIFKTNIELKVELESMKRELAEKQELLVSASKALESLAGRESGEPQRVREQAQRDIDALRDAFSKRIADLEESLQTAEEEVEKMATIAEQEKLKSLNMERQIQALGPPCTFPPVPSPVQDLQQALQEKDRIIEQLTITVQNQEAVMQQRKGADQETDAPSAERLQQLSDLVTKKDQELEALRNKLQEEKDRTTPDHQKQSDFGRLESCNSLLTEEIIQAKGTIENLSRTLDETQTQNKSLLRKLEDKENELNTENKNTLKRDKTIQGLTQVLREKEKEIAELCHDIEDRDDALAKARETAHKAQLQKYQGAEEHQNLLMERQTELAQLQGEHHSKVLETQKLQRGLDRKDQELADLQQAKEQLEVELEDMQQQKKKGDKALNDLNNQLKKLSGEIGERESALEQQYQDLLDQTKRKLQSHESTIQRLTTTLADKEQQLQEYINMVRDMEQSKSTEGKDSVLSKLRQRLREKEKALEQALDEKFAAVEEKDNEIHQLQLSLRERERDLDRLNNLLSHNEETINSFDCLIKEKDVELQHLANTLKNLQRSKQEAEDNLNRSLREKDSIISQLQLSLEGKTKDMEDMANSMLSQSQTHAHDLAEQMGQRLKVTEAMLAEAQKARERLIADNESAVEGLLATISSKDKLLKESAEHYNRMLSERTQEIQELRKQLSDCQQQLAAAERQSTTTAQEGHLETAELRALLTDKDSLINKLLQRGQERDQYLAETRQKEDHVLELRQTIQIMQEKLDERDAELDRRNSEDNTENIPLPKKTIVVLKKELAQKTEALNKALKRENELKISLAELQSLLSEREGRNEGQAANIESLTATLKTKDEIINVLHQRLGQRGDSRADHTQDQVISSGMERSLPGLPQRERTMIGGDSQQEAFPNLIALQQEHNALNKALRAEQQLYSSLVRTVKEQDSAQRLHALQLELTAVQLLRQQLEDSIKSNEELRDDLEREIHRAKVREGLDLSDPKELESVRHQLEDAQRWNASLQARLGAIQNRGGGVGGANDGGETLSFIGDQTSYLSICMGEGQDDSLSQLSAQELRQKVLELQDGISTLQTLNTELQNRLSPSEKSDYNKEVKDVASSSPSKQQLEKTQETRPVTRRTKTHQCGQDKESQTDIRLGQMVSGRLLDDTSMINQSREHTQSGKHTLHTVDSESRERTTDIMALTSLLADTGVTSVSHLREELLRLRAEIVELRGLLKEQKSTESKERASTDASGNSSDGQAELRKSMETLQAETEARSKLMSQPTEERERNSYNMPDGESPVSSSEGAQSPQTKGQTHNRSGKMHVTKHGAGVKSRLPVPVKLRVEGSSSRQSVHSDHLRTDALQHLHEDDVHGSEQHLHTDSDSSLRGYTCGSSQVETDNVSEAETTRDHTPANSALLTQLELLHQECQEKEALIHKLSEQLAEWEELDARLQEKDSLNRQYVEALQAAESTIAYLTACSLDSQGGFGTHAAGLCAGSGSGGSDAALHSKCMDLQTALELKEELNSKLIDLLSMAEKAISQSKSHDPENTDLCSQIETALQQAKSSSRRQSLRGVSGSTDDSMQELQRHVDCLQEALLEQNRRNAELQEKLRAADAAATNSYNSSSVEDQSSESKKDKGSKRSSDDVSLNQEMTKVLRNCLSAAESTIASLAANCRSTSSFASGRSSQSSSELQIHLEKLQKALEERKQLEEPTQLTYKPISNLPASSSGTKGEHHQDLHNNICLLLKVLGDQHQRISELQASLQEERGRKEDSKVQAVQGMLQDVKGLPPNVQLQLETLHKALREKKKACRSLEEKLASALSHTPSPDTTRRALEQDDKGVQVDFQDLGYETSGKSENDREESSSTDLEVGVKPSCSASSLPSLLKHEQANYSSTDNLDSTSSTPYPSSPAFSSAKVSLKGLQVYDEYGVSEDPHQLQGQVKELKVQLETQTKLILQMQSLLRRNSLCSDQVANTPDQVTLRDQEGTHRDNHGQDRGYRSGQPGEKKEGENQALKDKTSHLNVEVEGEKMQSRRLSDQLQQTRSRSTSPARLDSLVQSQARELSQLRQQIKESRRLGSMQRRQLEELNKAFRELLQTNKVDYYMGEVVKEQLDKSLGILDRLEGRLDKGDSHLDNEDVAALELSRRLAKELQEKNRVIQSLQSQLRGQSPSSHHSSHSDLYSDRNSSSSCYSSPTTQGGSRTHSLGQRPLADWTGSTVRPVGGAQEEGGVSEAGRLQGLHREKGRLQEQLRDSEELNATLRSELDLHRSIMAQTSFHHQEQDHKQDQDRAGPLVDSPKQDGDVGSQKKSADDSRTMNSDLLAEHLQEIRALRLRLEESIRTNDLLREQLEKRLAEVEKDPAATNIFIQGNEEQGQLANEMRYLWGQNQALKEQLSMGSRDKQKENEKLRESLARRTAKLEQSRKECDILRQENSRLQERLELNNQENAALQDSLHYSKEELHRLQIEVKLQRQQLSDSQHLLQSLRVELQVYEKIKTDARKQNESSEAAQDPMSVPPSSGPLDLSELLQEIRHLRLQLERSIQTNTALRQRLEEQLLRGPNRSETININYLLSSPEGGRSPGREGCDPHSLQGHTEHTGVLHGERLRAHSDGGSLSSSSSESVSGAPSRLVPGHRMWANRTGRHVLGLIEDYNALRKQISEGRKLSRNMEAQLQECLHAVRQQGSDNKVMEQQHLKSLCGSVNTMQQVLDEAGRLLKLVWRVSLPASPAAGDGSNNQQDELLKNEIARLKSRLSQQERMLSGAVKRLRSTNQLKEGMERVIIDQLYVTHGVLKKARGNLEEVPVSGL
ncbi:CDK5 regulatory subunit-associated protein 2 isoform X4 [Notolabrus celidotus]|uniref:CDK5 regulatory subunit-associated protein 2 isoform X4 n=1 Tax=Notolabrus celidotus TaxID=1203425 RepID=UPI00148FC2BE|nr:CDK5 regulatory subunit-associated protein 2 isoform X4 [Notolabrus celidotus]